MNQYEVSVNLSEYITANDSALISHEIDGEILQTALSHGERYHFIYSGLVIEESSTFISYDDITLIEQI